MALLKILYATEIYKIIPVTKGRVQRIYFIHLDLSFSVLAFFNNAHFTESQGGGIWLPLQFLHKHQRISRVNTVETSTSKTSQPAFTSSKLTKETLDQGAKYVQS